MGGRDRRADGLLRVRVIRLLRPDRYAPGEAVLAGTWRDVEDALFGFTLGGDYVHEEFVRGFAADLYLLAGGMVVALGLGIAGGVWCAARDRTRSARALEGAAVFFLCTPVRTARAKGVPERRVVAATPPPRRA